MQELSAIQARVLGCLMEKKETTPDQYPLTLNALRAACNQKSSRHPVTDYSEGEVGHALRELESMGLVREEWGARAPRYEHRVGQVLGLYRKGAALLCVLMLRGPQTPGELRVNTQRLFGFDDVDDVQFALKGLQDRNPPLVVELPRQPGQKEARYAHLLEGQPEIDTRPPAPPPSVAASGLEARVTALEAAVARLSGRLDALAGTDPD